MLVNIVRTTDKLFNYAECEELYNECNDRIQDDKFEDVIKRTDFYAFYIAQTSELIGCIYYWVEEDGKRYVNVFAKRGHHNLNLDCFKESLSWYDGDIYARCKQKPAILGALRCGFKKIGKNLYKKEKHNGQ